jgi:putative component of membrane protein insertase Oxa1/YidC/SpoIIIJ protein YidD
MALWRLARCNPWSHGGVDYAVKDGYLNNSQKTKKTTEKTSVGAN